MAKHAGLYKQHRKACPNRHGKDDAQCRCAWSGIYKSHRKTLGPYLGRHVDPQLWSDATKAFQEFQRRVDDGKVDEPVDPHAQGVTLADLIDLWQKGAVRRGRQNSGGDSAAMEVIRKGLGERSAAALIVRPSIIEDWLDGQRVEREWSAATWNSYREHIGRVFNHAVRRRVVPSNPVLVIEECVVHKESRVRRLPEAGDEAKLLASCRAYAERRWRGTRRLQLGDVIKMRLAFEQGAPLAVVARRFKVSVSTACEVRGGTTWDTEVIERKIARTTAELHRRLIAALDLGLRAGEMLRITTDMVKAPLVADGVTILPILLPPRITKGGKSTGDVETVYASTSRLVAVLTARVAQLKDHPPAYRYVFGTEDGAFVGSFGKAAKGLFTAAGITWGRAHGAVWHTLRHEAISRAAGMSGDLLATKKFARHRDVETTAGYLHPHDEDLLALAVKQARGK